MNPIPEPDERPVWDRFKDWIAGEKRGYRDLWLLVITAFSVLACIVALANVNEIQEGRRAGTGFTCAIAGAVAQAGRAVIEGGAKQQAPTPRAELLLQELGYPPKEQREKLALAAGEAYSANITTKLEEKAHIPEAEAKRIILKDGTVDCDQLKVLSKIR